MINKADIEKARDIVNKGWYQGYYTNGGDKYCVLGALGMATNGNPIMIPREVMDEVASHLADIGWLGGSHCGTSTRCSQGCTHIPHFNDDPNTTKEMVLQLFDKTIANL